MADRVKQLPEQLQLKILSLVAGDAAPARAPAPADPAAGGDYRAWARGLAPPRRVDPVAQAAHAAEDEVEQHARRARHGGDEERVRERLLRLGPPRRARQLGR